MDVTEVILRGKFITLNAFIRKQKVIFKEPKVFYFQSQRKKTNYT